MQQICARARAGTYTHSHARARTQDHGDTVSKKELKNSLSYINYPEPEFKVWVEWESSVGNSRFRGSHPFSGHYANKSDSRNFHPCLAFPWKSAAMFTFAFHGREKIGQLTNVHCEKCNFFVFPLLIGNVRFSGYRIRNPCNHGREQNPGEKSKPAVQVIRR